MSIRKPQYIAKVYETQAETRWFHRHVLRRKWQNRIIYVGPVTSFTIERNLNGLSNAVFVTSDPLEPPSLTEVRF